MINSISIDEVWKRLKKFEAQEFFTKRNLSFVFSIKGNVFRVSRTKYNISKSDFMKALRIVPLDGPGIIRNQVRGSTYIWAVLHDRRIRQQDW